MSKKDDFLKSLRTGCSRATAARAARLSIDDVNRWCLEAKSLSGSDEHVAFVHELERIEAQLELLCHATVIKNAQTNPTWAAWWLGHKRRSYNQSPPDALPNEVLLDERSKGPQEQIKIPERLKGESALWYGRFCDYYLPMISVERSVDAAYRRSIPPGRKQPKQPSSGWYRASQRYDWIERVETWDKAQRDQLLDDLVLERREDHRRRIEVLKATRARIIEALAALDVEEAKWSQIIQGVVAINGELRKEYGVDNSAAEPPVATLRPSDLDGLTDDQLDAVEAAARIIENSTDIQTNSKVKSSNLIDFNPREAKG